MIMEASHLVLFSIIVSVQSEERLSWFTTDPEVKKSIFVPDNLPEGKEENRVLPWVFHSADDRKIMELKCIMRGYNASNNPSDYKDARWSHPGFDESQVSVGAGPEKGVEDGVPYAIWSININTTAKDAGKKWATCEFQQGDFPLSTDFKFLIFKKLRSPLKNQKNPRKFVWRYVFGGSLEESDLNEQIEDDIKRQISEHYNLRPARRCRNRKRFCITEIKPKGSQKRNPVPIEDSKKQQQRNKQSRQRNTKFSFS